MIAHVKTIHALKEEKIQTIFLKGKKFRSRNTDFEKYKFFDGYVFLLELFTDRRIKSNLNKFETSLLQSPVYESPDWMEKRTWLQCKKTSDEGSSNEVETCRSSVHVKNFFTAWGVIAKIIFLLFCYSIRQVYHEIVLFVAYSAVHSFIKCKIATVLIK